MAVVAPSPALRLGHLVNPSPDSVAFLGRFIVGFLLGAGIVFGMILLLPLLLMAVLFILGLVGFAAVLFFLAAMFTPDSPRTQ
jgi:hypothetical protein